MNLTSIDLEAVEIFYGFVTLHDQSPPSLVKILQIPIQHRIRIRISFISVQSNQIKSNQIEFVLEELFDTVGSSADELRID